MPRFTRKPESDRLVLGHLRHAWLDTELGQLHFCSPQQTYERWQRETCHDCKGTGGCPQCDAGVSAVEYREETGQMEPETCPHCTGSTYCAACAGDGQAIYPTMRETESEFWERITDPEGFWEERGI